MEIIIPGSGCVVLRACLNGVALFCWQDFWIGLVLDNSTSTYSWTAGKKFQYSYTNWDMSDHDDSGAQQCTIIMVRAC